MAERFIRKPIGGPDRGETPVIPGPKPELVPTFTMPGGSLIEKSNRPAVNAYTVGVEDKYGRGIKISPEFGNSRLTIDNHPKKDPPKAKANGAELLLDPEGLNGVAIAYFDMNEFPFLRQNPKTNVAVEFGEHISDLSGRKERKVIFKGRNGDVAKSLTQFEFESPEETIAIKSTVQTTPTPLPILQTNKSIAA